MIQFGRDGHQYLILDTATATQLRFSRTEAKAAARFLMKELGVVSARLADGRDVCEIDELFKQLDFSEVCPTCGATKEVSK